FVNRNQKKVWYQSVVLMKAFYKHIGLGVSG
ncbi:MAG: hypothetical protein ACI8P3_004385, partial [Saprospiraceae bacterium]